MSSSKRVELATQMTDEESMQVEDLLMVWYGRTSRYRPALGAPRASIYSRGSESSDVYADADEIDARIEAEQAREVDKCMDRLSGAHRSAIGIHAANRFLGWTAFSNPRLSPEASHALYLEAKPILFRQFVREGLVRRQCDKGTPANRFTQDAIDIVAFVNAAIR